jgi:acyl-CoA thioesterase-1
MMESDMKLSLFRRHFSLLVLTACIAGPSGVFAQKTDAPSHPTILVVGDSLSAEYGLQRGQGWVALLQARLESEKSKYAVVNASISGDTTAGGRSRLPALLAQHRPAVVVIELGGNDALRGLALETTQQNLQAMAQAAQSAGARVLLLGMQVPPNYGQAYMKQFSDAYVHTAQISKAALVPFFLKGVADVPEATKLFQADRIHPIAQAHPQLLDNVWPELKKLLR